MHWNTKIVLVTGGAGAIGSRLVHGLLCRGCKEILVLDDLSSGRKENLPDTPEVCFIKDTIVNDNILDELFSQRIDVVFHLAANFANQNSVDHPELDLTTNGLGTLKLLNRVKNSRVERFVFASSSTVYCKHNGALREHFETDGLSTPYSNTKLLGERYTLFFHKHYGVKSVVLRYFNVYGPGEYPGEYRNVIPNFFALARDSKPLPITGTGDETRDFTFNSDTVEGTIRSAQFDEAIGTIINIASGKQTTILEVARQVNILTNNKSGVVFMPRRKWDTVSHRVASIQKARQLLHYEPKVDLEDGLSLTYNWLESILVEKSLATA